MAWPIFRMFQQLLQESSPTMQNKQLLLQLQFVYYSFYHGTLIQYRRLIQKEKVNFDGQKGAQISIEAENIVTKG